MRWSAFWASSTGSTPKIFIFVPPFITFPGLPGRNFITLKRIFYIIFLIHFFFLTSQNRAAAQDTLAFGKDQRREMTVSPMRATMLAAALPGLGQIYNRKYWKVPFVYAGFGGVGYAIAFNSKQYNRFTRAYIDFTDGIPETDSYLKVIRGAESGQINFEDPSVASWIQDQLLRQVDYYRKYRDLSYFGVAAWYLVTILDANVDASLFYYEVDENLNLTVFPSPLPAYNSYALGLNVSLKISF
jgi:hypothetical protein